MKNGIALIITASALVTGALAFDQITNFHDLSCYPRVSSRYPRADGDPDPQKKKVFCFGLDSRLRGNDELLSFRAESRNLPSAVPIIDAEAFLPAFAAPSQEILSLEMCERAVVMLVPHHDTAADMIASAFHGLKGCRKTPRAIVLLSPDHFFAAPGEIAVGQVQYATKRGIVETDAALLRSLQEAVGVKTDGSAFRNEHGIGILIPFVKEVFPEARILPVIVNQRIPEWRLQALADWLATEANQDLFVIVSADMSHYLPDTEAVARDRETRNALERKNAKFFFHATDDHTDNGKSIALIMRAMPELDWHLFSYKRSPEYGGSPRYTTTYLSGFWLSTKVPASSNIR